MRVILDETQREVLRRMQRVRHLKGADQAEVLRDPHAVFDGVAEGIDIDPGMFGPRVKGVGDFPFVVQPYLQRSATGIFEDSEEIAGRRERGKFSAGLKCCYVDGSIEEVAFQSREEVIELERAAKSAWQGGEGTVEWNKKSILIDESFVRALSELVERVTPAKTTVADRPSTPRRYLLIYTNENELEYEEAYQGEGGETDLEIPKALKSPDLLKDHQRAGIAWLQRNFRLNRHGCLLADDMGLGKTLQVLTFLAWLIEKGDLSREDTNPEAAPWDPILIVTPVILLESETWLNDMRTFFAGEGTIFNPLLSLHGATLKTMRRPNVGGRETVLGEAVLDLDRLRQHRVVLTNYETVTNYQHSFARMKEHWTVVVTDEAQEYKTPNTKISHALKSLSPRFRVACTGTPVETRLLDVWNLFDFLQPGHLLGSATEFTKQYEAPIEQQPPTTSSTALSQLKDRLYFGRDDAFVLRREKT
ncbi:MAG: DEAD/DEAH box helicase, partial [Terriglobia bacterium]